MKFKFLGDTKNMKVFGYDFSDGATPDVTDEKAIAKLLGNAEFKAIEDAPAQPAPPTPAKEEKPKGEKKEEKQKEEKTPSAGDGENANLPGMGA